MAEQVEVILVETQRLADLLDLVHEARQFPEIRILGLVAVVGAELVVVVVLDTRSGKVAVERLQILVREPGSPMQKEHLHLGIVADALGPDAKSSLRCLDGDLLDAGAQDVITTGIVEVGRRRAVRALRARRSLRDRRGRGALRAREQWENADGEREYALHASLLRMKG